MEQGVEQVLVKMSVRNLVEFLLRSGDIDNRHGGRNAVGTMQEGTKIHRMIQKLGGASYQAEVPLKFIYYFGEENQYALYIDGRADGIFEGEECVVIDEIKGTYRDVMKIKTPDLLHKAQAMCYGYMYSKENELDGIGIQITYCNIESMEINRHYEYFTFEEIEKWFLNLMEQYSKWVIFEVDWRNTRRESLKALKFPFEYREGQKELAVNVYSTICHEKKLFIEAPTGVGKTITTVFPSLKAMGEGKADRLFYFTAKTITRTVADDTFQLLRDRENLRLKTVLLTAKEKICPLEEMECNPAHCPYAAGHFDRINDAIYDLITHEDSFTREKILEYSQKYSVCPFEFSLDASLFSDAIICDYNYLFDPHVYLKRFFAEGSSGDYLFLVDEAHNLLERGREMYSAVLMKEAVLELRRELKIEAVKGKLSEIPVSHADRIIRNCEKVNKAFLALKHTCDREYRVVGYMDILDLAGELNKLSQAIDKYLEEEDGGGEIRKLILDFYFELSHFLLIWDNLDDHFQIYLKMEENGGFSCRLFCIDPSSFLRECMDKGVSSTLFSATLLPIQYYKGLLGGEPTDYEVYAHSVFNEEQKGLFIASDVTTKYTERTDAQYERIAEYIDCIISKRKGNYMVFFPSYAFAGRVFELFESKIQNRDIECLSQNERMSELDREQFLGAFNSNAVECNHTLIGFCVMGGIFSEGIDLKGDSLIGAIVVGNGLPQTCAERTILKDYFDAIKGSGFDYAFRYPGMNKVLQSAGRVIRTAADVGIIALLDYRFLEKSYQTLFPREWKNYTVVNLNTVSSHIAKFWDKWNFDQIG